MNRETLGPQEIIVIDMDEAQSLNGRGNIQDGCVEKQDGKASGIRSLVQKHFSKYFKVYAVLLFALISCEVMISIVNQKDDNVVRLSYQLQFLEKIQNNSQPMKNQSKIIEQNQITNGNTDLQKNINGAKSAENKAFVNQSEQVSIQISSKNENVQSIHIASLMVQKKLTDNNWKSIQQRKEFDKIGVKPLNNILKYNPNSESKDVVQKNPPRMVAGIDLQQKELSIKLLELKNQDLSLSSPLAQREKEYYEKKYEISRYEELPFCIVIPSFNNVKNNLHLKNIRSVLMQDYTNYHIVFIDDASTDGTGEQIQAFLENNQTRVPSSRYTVIRNAQQKRAMPNLRMAAKEHCKPQDIFLIADGDDELLGRQVLKLFNAVFQKEKAWFVYTNFLSIRHSVGYSRPFPITTVKNNKYRTYPFVTSHLRAFYTQLFLNIKEEDLKDDNGAYLKAANDVAICIPILEMSHERVRYVPELTYFYNSNTGQNNHQVRLKQQKDNNKMIRKRAHYSRLQSIYSPIQHKYEMFPLISRQDNKSKVKNETSLLKNEQKITVS